MADDKKEDKKTTEKDPKAPAILVEPTKGQAKMANAFDYNAAEVAVIQNTVAKNTTKMELAYFLNVCKSMEMNPFNKEVWCYKDGQGNLIMFAGRDGFLAKAQRNPIFNGIRSSEVCANDHIVLDIPNGKVDHKIDPKKPRGAIIGAYCFIFRKDGEATIEWATFETYDKRRATWKTHPAEMIKKVAECHALKKCFGISGVQSEYDFNVEEGVAVPIDTTGNEERLIDIIEEKPEN